MAPHVTIGVLALQGAFIEHIEMLNRIEGVQAMEVRTKDHLEGLDGLVLPGGESTTMGLVAEGVSGCPRTGILPHLRRFVGEERKPTFGTCAGLIMLAESAKSMKEGGQPLLGGLKVHVDRNHFGSQIQSFERELEIANVEDLDLSGCQGVFIRAPVVLKTLDPSVKVLARLPDSSTTGAPLSDGEERIVAVQQEQLLATAFHPELTEDQRWHEYFVNIVRRHKQPVASS